MRIWATIGTWSSRALALTGLGVGDVDEETITHFRVVGSAFGSLAVLAFVLLRFATSAAWDPILRPVLDENLTWHTSQVSVVKALHKGADGDPRYPYGFWTSDRLKWTYNVDPHVRVGDHIVNHMDHGAIIRYQVIHGRRYWSPWVTVPLWLAAALALLVAVWSVSVAAAFMSFMNIRRIRRDRVTGPVTRQARLEAIWCPWSPSYLARVHFPLTVPVTLRDCASSRTFTVQVKPDELPTFSGTDGAAAAPAEVQYYPHTGALVRATTQSHDARSPAMSGQMTRRMLAWTRLDRVVNVGWATPCVLARLRNALGACAAAGLLFYGVALLSAPALVPYWLPVYTTHERVKHVFPPFTIEPSGYPWELESNLGKLYWFASDPEVHVNAQFVTRRDWRGELLGSTLPARTYHSGIRNHPVDLLVLICSALIYLWTTRRRAGDLSRQRRGRLAEERITFTKEALLYLPSPGRLRPFGYPLVARRASTGKRLVLRLSSRQAATVSAMFEDLQGAIGELDVSYYVSNREVATLAPVRTQEHIRSETAPTALGT